MTEIDKDEHAAKWPTRDILSLGYFGSGTPEGARYRNRSLSALALLVIGSALCAAFKQFTPLRFLMAALPGLAFGYIAWEWWRYINHLDELARRLQMEAMAWTYLIGLFAAMALGGVCAALNWPFNPVLFIVLELVRAHRLLVLSRRV